MNRLIKLMEIITIILWVACIAISVGGGSIKYIVGIVCITTAVWVFILAALYYKNKI